MAALIAYLGTSRACSSGMLVTGDLPRGPRGAVQLMLQPLISSELGPKMVNGTVMRVLWPR
jgi:hypothetical protein